MTTSLLTDAHDIQWLKTVHLKNASKIDLDRIKSAMVFGNEDAPDQVLCWDVEFPDCNRKPFLEFNDNDTHTVIILNK
jgi:hypothetical protein